MAHPSTLSMQAVEATIDAAEVALEELQRLFSALAADEQQHLPPGIAARTARLAEIAGVLAETAGLLQGPVVSAHSGDDEPPTGSGKGFASRIKTGVRTQGTRLTQRRHGSFSRASGMRPWDAESGDVALAAAQFHSVFTGNAESPSSWSSPPDAAPASARALADVHAQTAESEQVEAAEELESEPERPPTHSRSGRSGFASRIKTNVQTQGTRLNIRRQGSFGRMPVMGNANAADGYIIDGIEVGFTVGIGAEQSAEQAALAFQAAFRGQ